MSFACTGLHSRVVHTLQQRCSEEFLGVMARKKAEWCAASKKKSYAFPRCARRPFHGYHGCDSARNFLLSGAHFDRLKRLYLEEVINDVSRACTARVSSSGTTLPESTCVVASVSEHRSV